MTLRDKIGEKVRVVTVSGPRAEDWRVEFMEIGGSEFTAFLDKSPYTSHAREGIYVSLNNVINDLPLTTLTLPDCAPIYGRLIFHGDLGPEPLEKVRQLVIPFAEATQEMRDKSDLIAQALRTAKDKILELLKDPAASLQEMLLNYRMDQELESYTRFPAGKEYIDSLRADSAKPIEVPLDCREKHNHLKRDATQLAKIYIEMVERGIRAQHESAQIDVFDSVVFLKAGLILLSGIDQKSNSGSMTEKLTRIEELRKGIHLMVDNWFDAMNKMEYVRIERSQFNLDPTQPSRSAN